MAFAAAILDMTALYRVHALPVVIFVVLMAMVGIYTIHVRDYAVAGAWQPLTVVEELLGVHTSNIRKM